jgi:hypothetical protein
VAQQELEQVETVLKEAVEMAVMVALAVVV